MKNCSDIENLLPLYQEGVLSEEEKRTVDEHLAQCDACRKEMADLQKADELIKALPPVEEPPWFEQKIMARVREEADKKQSARRWFYPLRFKIPLQVMATLVIAVLAVYIYRTGDEQVQSVLPGAQKPSVEVMKEQPPAPVSDETGSFKQDLAPEKKPHVHEETKKDRVPKERVIGTGDISRPDALPAPTDAVVEAHGPAAKGRKTPSQDKADGVDQTRQNEVAVDGDQIIRQKDQAITSQAKKRESYGIAVPAAPQAMGTAAPRLAEKFAAVMPEARVQIKVDDLSAAVSEAEKILVRYGAKKLTRKPLEGGATLLADVSASDWKEILAGLKTIGLLEEKGLPADSSGQIRLTIEMSGK